MNVFLVFLGGGLGAVARYFLTTALTGKLGIFPVGTFAANVSGSFLMGIVLGFLTGKTDFPVEPARSFAAVGFLGGFTTFSSFSADTLNLINSGNFLSAILNIVLSCGAGLLAVAAGFAVQKFFEGFA